MKKLIFTLPFILLFFGAKANDSSFDPDSLCSVTLQSVQNGFCLQANPTGTAPFTYLWSDGSVTETACSNNPLTDTLCVTVTDASGCVALACGVLGNPPPNCDVWIVPDSITQGPTQILHSFSSGNGPFTYLWSTGENTASISITASGTYCVTITDIDGCEESSCLTINLNNPNNCSVDLVQVMGTSCLQAIPTGTAPFQYLWSTGNTTDTECSNSPVIDSVCVTIIDSNGCEATACGVFGNGGTGINCDVNISYTNTGLVANASGDSTGTYTYLWSSGETTSNITPSTTGTYCVTVTGASGCEATDCAYFELQIDNDINGYIVLDTLGGSTSGVNTFIVYLIEHDSVAGTLTAIDSVILTSTPNFFGGYYSFTDLQNGEYLVKAALQPGSDQYDNYLPTYYGNVLYWNEANYISVPSGNDFADINMIEGVNPGGPGFIGGLISEGANFTSGQVEIRDEGDPIANVSVLLLTENDEAVTHTITDTDGMFEFENLAYGTYKLVVEILGKEQGIHFVTISADNPNATINFGVNEGNVTDVSNLLNEESLSVFPNPVEDKLNIYMEVLENTPLNISVINLLGKTVMTQNVQLNIGEQSLRINLGEFPNGVYFLNFSDGKNIISRKIMKK